MIIIKAKLYWNEYKYMPYERKFAYREIESLIRPKSIEVFDKYIEIDCDNLDEKIIKRLTYFLKIEFNSKLIYTNQYLIERSPLKEFVNRKTQSTRYSVHGMHEYKGKFNPQMVKSVLNMLNIRENSKVLDPFCGSGTTLVECTNLEISSVGLDINPFAVYLANAKLDALSIDHERISSEWSNLFNTYTNLIGEQIIPETLDERKNYLLKWFPENIFLEIELLKKLIDEYKYESSRIFMVLISDLLRDYSLQEPADLRIRRRKTPMPETPFRQAVNNKFKDFMVNLIHSQKNNGVLKKISVAQLSDSRDNQEFNQAFDAAITSPPYSTALPYIDTQRLSLVWLELCEQDKIISLEKKLTGSREIAKKEKDRWNELLFNNEGQLPENLFSYCTRMYESLLETDGFRRQAVPALLYKYLCDMKSMFQNVKLKLKKNTPYALIVGHNQTTLGGVKFDIDTPEFLVELATSLGWEHIESLRLETFQRFGLNYKNSINEETLIILRNT